MISNFKYFKRKKQSANHKTKNFKKKPKEKATNSVAFIVFLQYFILLFTIF